MFSFSFGGLVFLTAHYELENLNNYHAEINEQNSAENCSDGAVGGG